MPINWDEEVQYLYNPRPTPKSGIIRRVVGDTAVDIGKGVVGLGQSAVGLADLATFGLAGDGLKAIGYDPQATEQWLGEYYSPERQAAEDEVSQAEGFMGKMGALATNPSALIGRGVQSAPQMLGAMGAANKAFQATKSIKAATMAGSAAEGAMTAGSVAQDIRNQGGDRADMYWAVPAGVATGAIGYGAGRLLPEGQIETMLIPGARKTMAGQPAGLLRRTGAGVISEGVLEEAPQSGSEQMFTNMGTGKPLMYQVPEAMGEGLMVGGAMGGVLGGVRRSAPPQPKSLLPGANLGRGETNEGSMPMQPRLDPYANYGETGTLFGGQPDLMPMDGAAAPEAYNEKLNDLIRLQQMAEQAQASGNIAELEFAQEAIRQLSSQMAGMGVNDLNQTRLFSGVHELVGDRAYELTDPEAAAGGLPTLDGEREQVPQDTRMSEIRNALTQANNGKANAQLLRFIPEFRAALNQGPDAVQAVIEKYDNSKSTLQYGVFETAAELADVYRRQDVNGMAMQGASRAQPGVQVGQAPVSDATEMQMRERNTATQAKEANAAAQQQLAGAIADTDARVSGGQQQRSAQERRGVLDSVLDGAANAGNARNRFIKALRKQGIKDTTIRSDEQRVIDSYFNAKEAFPDENAPIPSAPNELVDVVPERRESPTAPAGRPARQNANKSFQLTSPPSTEADTEALAKAKAKRERKAGVAKEEPSPEGEGTTDRAQGKLFTAKGKPSAAATNEPAPKKPRKAKVKAKVGEQEVELEVADAESRVAELEKDISKFEAFVACLRKR